MVVVSSSPIAFVSNLDQRSVHAKALANHDALPAEETRVDGPAARTQQCQCDTDSLEQKLGPDMCSIQELSPSNLSEPCVRCDRQLIVSVLSRLPRGRHLPPGPPDSTAEPPPIVGPVYAVLTVGRVVCLFSPYVRTFRRRRAGPPHALAGTVSAWNFWCPLEVLALRGISSRGVASARRCPDRANRMPNEQYAMASSSGP
jgi:hypothetical protein